MSCYQRDLLQVPILLKVTVVGIGKMKRRIRNSIIPFRINNRPELVVITLYNK